MATLDLTAASDRDGFVIYFGGKPNEVNTYTFANALVALSDTFRAINEQVNPGYAIELRLEAVAEGSFKAKVKERKITLAEVLKYASHNVVLPIMVSWFFMQYVEEDDAIVVNTDEVVIQRGHDRIIVPREAYNRAKAIPKNGKVAAEFSKAIEAVEDDPNVTSLGILRDLKSEDPPAIMVPREDFARIRAMGNREEGKARSVLQEATITILKAVYGKADRKWDFVWNGVKITAFIRDPVFLADVQSRRYLIGTGDALRVTLSIDQVWDDGANVWLNASYAVAHVHEFVPGPQTSSMDF